MSKYQDPNNLGEQFKNAVTDALNTGDFARLNFLVSDTVSDVIAEATRQVKNVATEAQREIHRTGSATSTRQTQRASKPAKTLPTVRNVGQVSSVLYKVFGGIATGISGSILLGKTIAAILMQNIYAVPSLVFLGLLFAGSLGMLRKGINQSNRLTRMKRYLSICAGKMYMNISDLAKHANKSPKYILKDIKKMLKLGFFPEGHLDAQETCLMLDDATYREYLRLEKERKAYLAQVQTASPAQNAASGNFSSAGKATDSDTTPSPNTTQGNAGATDPKLIALVSEGQEYIRKLHELNDIIEDEVVSDKLYRMEDLLREIFERVEEDPSQMPHMHKLMSYYLPTTIKLLQAYADFDDVSMPGPDILAAKKEIENTIDTINEAFSELLNKLFHDTVFDVTTDAQVLKTMLAQEGLTKNKFSEDKK